MTKNILSFAIVLGLTTSVIAGGDDRDLGPVESLETVFPMRTAPVNTVAPIPLSKPLPMPLPISVKSVKSAPLKTVAPLISDTPKVVVSRPVISQRVDVNTQVQKTTKSSATSQASSDAQIACQEKFALSEHNILIFRKAQKIGYLYNTGPIEGLRSTIFSPERWGDYLSCIDLHDN